jgi:hypothetical protein
VDIKRIAFETKPINQLAAAERPAARAASGATVDRASIAALVDRFLAERHVHQPSQQGVASASAPASQPRSETLPQVPPPAPAPTQPQAASSSSNGAVDGRAHDFVCEEDVKRAIAAREKIYINQKTIITPAARELGDEREVFART